MIIPVMGMDPSLLHWGLASADLDLTTGILTTPFIQVIEPSELEGKNIRVNSNDLFKSRQIAEVLIPLAQKAKVIFVEVPVGSQSARAMAGYGICVGILSTLQALGCEIIQVGALESKKALTGNKNATKQQMIDYAYENYPQANWYWNAKKDKLLARNEHAADAIAAIHSGVNTPIFQNLMRILQKV